MCLYHNGVLYDQGLTVYMTDASSENVIADTFLVPCSVGDTLQPGYYSSLSDSTTFVGEATGTMMVFEILAQKPLTIT